MSEQPSIMPQTDTPSPVNENGAFVFERFKDVDKARKTLQALDRQDEKHAQDRKLHKGMINGNRPYNQERLKAAGQGWRCNVNFREAESIRDMNAGAYWSMMMDVPAFIDVTFKDPKLDPTQTFLWSSIIAEEYSRLLSEWPSLHYHVSLCVQEFLIAGIGAFHFKDAYTWRFKAVKRENMRFRTADSSDPSSMTILYIRDTMSPHDLYNAIEAQADSKVSVGWDPEQVRRALVKKYVAKDLTAETDIQGTAGEKLQAMFKNGEYGAEIDELEDLQIVWQYVREPDGKYSEYLFVEDPCVTGYMFKHPSKYERLTQFFVPFFYTIGDGDVGSVRGLGNRMFGSVEYSNRLMCGIMDGAWLGSSMVVKDMAGDNRVMNIERIGPFTKIPANVQPIQTSFTPQFGQLADVRNMIEMMQNNNNGIYKRQMTMPGGGPRSATESRQQAERDTQFSGQQVGNFYIYWTLLHREILERILSNGAIPPGVDGREQANEFIKQCKARGVPGDLLKTKVMVIDTMRAIGSGSNYMKKQSSARIYSLSNGMDEIGRQNAFIDVIASEVGYRRASRYVANLNRNLIPTDSTSVAMLENNDMAQGNPVVVGTDQKHLLHALTHIQPITETIQQYMSAAQSGQPMDPRQLLPFWQAGVQHINDHANRMRNDPRYSWDVKMIDQALKQIVPIVKQAMRIAESQNADELKAQQEALASMQAQPQMTPEMQVELEKAKGELAIKAQVAQAEIAMKQAKAEQAMAIKEAQAEQKMRHKERAAEEREVPGEVIEEPFMPFEV